MDSEEYGRWLKNLNKPRADTVLNVGGRGLGIGDIDVSESLKNIGSMEDDEFTDWQGTLCSIGVVLNAVKNKGDKIDFVYDTGRLVIRMGSLVSVRLYKDGTYDIKGG
jgi:hypothetical protein